MKTIRARMMHPSGKPTVINAVWPNEGVAMWYQTQLTKLIDEMYLSSRTVVLPAVNDTPAILAHDGASPNCAGVVFRVGNRVLLVKRTDTRGWWGFPGGGMEQGETPEQTARRETWEEIQFYYKGPLQLLHIHKYRLARFVTYLAEMDGVAMPSLVLNDEHTEYKWITPEAAIAVLDLHPGVKLTLTELIQRETGVAMDASPTKQLQRALEKWGDQWVKKFDIMSKKLSVEFANKSGSATQTSMMAAFKQAGFTIAFKPTRAAIEAYQAVAAEQVGLIRSIPQRYLTDVQSAVWEAVKRGGALKELSEDLEKNYGVTRKRAALIARDQNRKAKETIEDARLKELGLRQAIWMHSHAGKEPRPTHVKMNNKLYDLDRGMYDPDPRVSTYIWPGMLINCRCSKRVYVPGFEDIRPEWGLVQT